MVTRSEADNLWRGSFCSLEICSFFRLCPGELSGVMSISLNAVKQTANSHNQKDLFCPFVQSSDVKYEVIYTK